MAGVNKVCSCGNSFQTTESEIRKGRGKFCSAKCYHDSRRGKRSTHWKGGRKIDSLGYVCLYIPNHPSSDVMGYVREHVLVMSSHIGRMILPNEVVHHINGTKGDNKLENLKLMQRGDHISLHQRGRLVGKETRRKISESKLRISHLIQRDNEGRFLGGVSYGG